MPLAYASAPSLAADLTPGDWARRTYPGAIVRHLPATNPTGDTGRAFVRADRGLRAAPVVLFPSVPLVHLDAFFRLRLLQILRYRPVFPGMSIVELAPGAGPVAGGFADRFRAAWPFAQCLFVTSRCDLADGFAAQLGLPVTALTEDPMPAPLSPERPAKPKIAVQLQPLWRRCGSTTVFENQLESLVRAGYFTIRVFQDPRMRRGPTLDRRLAAALSENQTHAGAHANIAAVPEGLYPHYAGLDEATQWAVQLQETANSRMPDSLLAKAARRAEVVIANHLERVGLALTLASRARLMLEAHDDRVTAQRLWVQMHGASAAQIEQAADAAAFVQARVLGIPDLTAHVSTTEAKRLGPLSPRHTVVLPRIYADPVPAAEPARFDLLLTGDAHVVNIASLRWFLAEVWKPYLAAANLRVAIVGRAGERLDMAALGATGLHVAGFVEDLEAFRAGCRLTVIPDQGGTGISVKLLTTLAAGHPVVTTTPGLRGLDPAIIAGLPACDLPAALAADILSLLRDPAKLAQRRDLVQTVHRRISQTTDHAALLASVPLPDRKARASRIATWASLVALAETPPVAPFRFSLDNSFSLSGGPQDAGVLLGNWHEPEPWGRWTDGAEAGLHIVLTEPTQEPLRLAMDISLPSVQAGLTLLIDGVALPRIEPEPGPNEWDIPEDLTRGKAAFVLTLRVDRDFRPCDQAATDDDRVLGIGLRAVRLRSRQPTLFTLGQVMALTLQRTLHDVLVAGWHIPEDWGCWTSGSAAELRMHFTERLSGVMRLDIDIAPSPINTRITLAVDGQAMPEAIPVAGMNQWLLPLSVTQGKSCLLVRLTVPETFRPSDLGGSADDRLIGIGVKAIGLTPVRTGISVVNEMLSLSRSQPLRHVLLQGWHPQEDWGCWSSGSNAVLRLVFGQPLRGAFRLEMNLMLTPLPAELTVTVGTVELPPVRPKNGLNTWQLPPACIGGSNELEVRLHVPEAYDPAAMSGASHDDRVLGVGLKSIGVFREAEDTAWLVGELLRINAETGWRGIKAAGWHRLERWGVWSASQTASFYLRFDKPLGRNMLLLLDLAPTPREQVLTLIVDGTALDPVKPYEGVNHWDLPGPCTQGKTSLTVQFVVDALIRPKDIQPSQDDRLLGVGIRSLGLQSLT